MKEKKKESREILSKMRKIRDNAITQMNQAEQMLDANPKVQTH
jgi:hypothetical protein